VIVDLIPAKYRQLIYVLLAVANAVQLAFGVLDADTWGRVLSAAASLGFGLAAANVQPKIAPIPNPPEEG
jgi:hypothetical protein